MNEQQQADALAAWLARGGGPLPEGLDPDVVEALLALRPELAPPPALDVDELLGALTEGPLAAPPLDRAAPRLPPSIPAAGPGDVPAPANRPWRGRWMGVAGLLAAALVTIVVVPQAPERSGLDAPAAREEALAEAAAKQEGAAPAAPPAPAAAPASEAGGALAGERLDAHDGDVTGALDGLGGLGTRGAGQGGGGVGYGATGAARAPTAKTDGPPARESRAEARAPTEAEGQVEPAAEPEVGSVLTKDFLQRIPSGRSYEDAVQLTGGVTASPPPPPEAPPEPTLQTATPDEADDEAAEASSTAASKSRPTRARKQAAYDVDAALAEPPPEEEPVGGITFNVRAIQSTASDPALDAAAASASLQAALDAAREQARTDPLAAARALESWIHAPAADGQRAAFEAARYALVAEDRVLAAQLIRSGLALGGEGTAARAALEELLPKVATPP